MADKKADYLVECWESSKAALKGAPKAGLTVCLMADCLEKQRVARKADNLVYWRADPMGAVKAERWDDSMADEMAASTAAKKAWRKGASRAEKTADWKAPCLVDKMGVEWAARWGVHSAGEKVSRTVDHWDVLMADRWDGSWAGLMVCSRAGLMVCSRAVHLVATKAGLKDLKEAESWDHWTVVTRVDRKAA
jgi:hypothetical protein